MINGRPSSAATEPTTSPARRATPAIADRRELPLPVSRPRRLRTRVAGIFLFLPLLARLRFDELVRDAGYRGSQMVPADAALLSLLVLKLLDKERKSHIDDFNSTRRWDGSPASTCCPRRASPRIIRTAPKPSSNGACWRVGCSG